MWSAQPICKNLLMGHEFYLVSLYSIQNIMRMYSVSKKSCEKKTHKLESPIAEFIGDKDNRGYQYRKI